MRVAIMVQPITRIRWRVVKDPPETAADIRRDR
jgi:hypothetical protein